MPPFPPLRFRPGDEANFQLNNETHDFLVPTDRLDYHTNDSNQSLFNVTSCFTVKVILMCASHDVENDLYRKLTAKEKVGKR